MLAQHLVFTCYGFWLPNDPRASGSDRVRAQHLYEIGGPATKVDTAESVAHVPHDHELRLATKAALARPAVTLSGVQARAVARGIGVIREKLGFKILACSVLPDHVHTVVGPHRLPGDELIAAMKRAATQELNAEGLHPFQKHPRANGKLPSLWGGGGWKVFLFEEKHLRNAIRYVERNPVRAGLKRQRWSFVEDYE